MTTMIAKAISAFLKSGEAATELCNTLRTLVRKQPVRLQRIADCGMEDQVMTPLPVYRWSVEFRTKEELMRFDAVIGAIVRLPDGGERE